MKSVRIRNYSGAHFPAFGLNTDRYSVFLRIQLECGPYSVQMRENAYQNNSEYGYLLRSLLKMVLVLYEYFLLQQSFCRSVSLSLYLYLYFSLSLLLSGAMSPGIPVDRGGASKSRETGKIETQEVT